MIPTEPKEKWRLLRVSAETMEVLAECQTMLNNPEMEETKRDKFRKWWGTVALGHIAAVAATEYRDALLKAITPKPKRPRKRKKGKKR